MGPASPENGRHIEHDLGLGWAASPCTGLGYSLFTGVPDRAGPGLLGTIYISTWDGSRPKFRSKK